MHPSRIALVTVAFSALLAGRAPAQGTPPATPQSAAAATAGAAMTENDIKAFAVLHVAISVVHDSVDARLAEAKNKTASAQQALRERLRTEVAAVISKSGLTEAEYARRRYVVSTDGETRKKFDTFVAGLTGVPLPGQVPVVAAAATIAVPPGAAGAHIGHVVNAYGDTPGGIGLLPTALAEARTAAQHATLATRTPTDLTAMKTHAGHVLHALDPPLVTAGPGKGYGVKRSAANIAAHIELAAKAEGATPAITMHATHIAAAARSTGTRVDQIIALAKQIQASTVASEAAALVAQMVSLSDQLLSGIDINADGRIGWDGGEGGLQQVQQHVNLMLAPEKK